MAGARATKPDDPVMAFASATAWEQWLAVNHATSRGVWLKIAKKTAPHTSVTYAEALDAALAWGWIDSQKRGFDEHDFLQRFGPRGAKSLWSKINCAKVEALVARGAMRAPGLAAVEAAKGDGRWDAAYAGAKTITVPDDLAVALDANARAKAFFATLDGTNRYAVLWRVHTAKKAVTRAERIAKLVAMLARGEKIHG